MSADDKFPRWVRVSTIDMTTAAGRYILAGHSTSSWADYGRYFALLQLVAREPDAAIDIHDDRRLRALAAELNLTANALRTFLGMLADGGAIERDSYEAGKVSMQDASNAARGFRDTCRRNRENGSKSKGRPPKEAKPTVSANESITQT